MLRTAVRAASAGARAVRGAANIHTSTATPYNEDLDTQKVERLEKTLNQVTLLGRVGADPEKRGTDQHPVVTFSLATHTNYRKNDDLIQLTDWHRIAVFKPYLRDNVYRYMSKGQRVMVMGRLGYLERKDPSSNTVLKSATIVAEDVVFFNKGASEGF